MVNFKLPSFGKKKEIAQSERTPPSNEKKTKKVKVKAQAGSGKNTLKIGKTNWAINLRWVPNLSSIKNETEKRRWIKDFAKTNKMDFALVKAGQTTGFTSKSKGHKKKMPSLAAAISAAYPGNFIAMFETDIGYYFVASKNGSVDPSSDNTLPLNSPRERIYDQLEKMHETFDGNSIELTVFADEKFGFDGTKQWPTSLEKLKPNYKLQDVDPSAQVRLIVTRIVLFGAFGGVMYWTYGLYEKMTAPPPPPKELVLPAKPWANKEKADQAIMLCLQGFEKMPQGGPGWKPKVATCKDGFVSVAFTRDKDIEKGGIPYSWLTESIETLGYPVKQISVSKNGDFIYTMPIPLAPETWVEKTTPEKINVATEKVQKRSDDLFKKAVSSEKKEKYYITSSIRIDTHSQPQQISEIASDIEGLYLDRIEFTPSQNKYGIVLSITNEQNVPAAEKISYRKPTPVRTFDEDYAKVYAK